MTAAASQTGTTQVSFKFSANPSSRWRKALQMIIRLMSLSQRSHQAKMQTMWADNQMDLVAVTHLLVYDTVAVAADVILIRL